MTRSPAITVLIPAYRAAGFIRQTLESISAQTRCDFVAIVSVDSQGDGTFQACREHALQDRRFEVIQQPTRLGWVGNSNFLLGQVRSPYALFAFHDDLLAPTYFERLAAALDADPLASVAFSDTLMTHATGTELWQYAALDRVDRAVERGLTVLSRRGQWWVPNRGLMRTTAMRKVGSLKYHDSGEFAADLPWVFHLALAGRFVRVPETLCIKHYMPDSLSLSWDYSNVRLWFDVLVSCMREIWLSDLSAGDKLALAEPLLVALKQALPAAYPPGVASSAPSQGRVSDAASEGGDCSLPEVM